MRLGFFVCLRQPAEMRRLLHFLQRSAWKPKRVQQGKSLEKVGREPPPFWSHRDPTKNVWLRNDDNDVLCVAGLREQRSNFCCSGVTVAVRPSRSPRETWNMLSQRAKATKGAIKTKIALVFDQASRPDNQCIESGGAAQWQGSSPQHSKHLRCLLTEVPFGQKTTINWNFKQLILTWLNLQSWCDWLRLRQYQAQPSKRKSLMCAGRLWKGLKRRLPPHIGGESQVPKKSSEP